MNFWLTCKKVIRLGFEDGSIHKRCSLLQVATQDCRSKSHYPSKKNNCTTYLLEKFRSKHSDICNVQRYEWCMRNDVKLRTIGNPFLEVDSALLDMCIWCLPFEDPNQLDGSKFPWTLCGELWCWLCILHFLLEEQWISWISFFTTYGYYD